MDVGNRGWVVTDAKVVGIRMKGCVMVAGRFQKGCGKDGRSSIGCSMVDGRFLKRLWEGNL